MINIILNNIWSKISNINDIDIIDALDNELSFFVEGFQYTGAYKNGWFDVKEQRFKHWDGKRHLLTSKMSFPTGLLNRVESFLKIYNLEYLITDNRENFITKEIPTYCYTPREYQLNALNEALKYGRGLIRIATGGGKSLLASMILAKYNLPSIIFVIGKDLLYQFYDDMKKVLNQEVGIIGDGKCEIRKFNVCSVWTAVTSFDLKQKISLDDEDWAPEVFEINKEQKIKIKNLIESSNVIIYDEAHYLATETIQSIYKVSKKCRYLFGMTGTPWRDDGADLLLESICGPIIYNMPASKLIKEKFLVPANIIIYDVPTKEIKTNSYHGIYSKYITENEVRNGMICDAVRALVAKNKKVLILVKHISHGNNIKKMLCDIPLYFVNGEIDGETRLKVKQSFENGEYKCLIASSVYDIGVDIPCLDALILGGGGKSTVRALQRIGRVIRIFKNKKNAIVVDFFDNIKYLDKHSAIRLSVYETESEFKIKFPDGFNYDKFKRSHKIQKKVSL